MYDSAWFKEIYGFLCFRPLSVLYKKARDRTVVFDVVSAWLVVGAKHDNSEMVCMEASLDVVDADHSNAREDVVQQVEGNDDKVVYITEHGIVNLEVAYEMGLSACGKSEKNTRYIIVCARPGDGVN